MPKLIPILSDKLIQHHVTVLRLAESAREKVLAELVQLEPRLLMLVHSHEALLSVRAKTERLIAEARQIITRTYRQAAAVLDSELASLAQFESRNLPAALVAARVPVEFDSLAVGIADKMISEAIVIGHRITDWWTKQIIDTQTRFAGQTRISAAAGENAYQLVQRIIGRPTGQRSVLDLGGSDTQYIQRGGGILNMSYYQASGLVHTAAQSITSQIDNQIYDENEGTVVGQQAIVTLDGRTSDICHSRAGGAWDSNGEPLEQSAVKIRYPGPAPWHWKCRTFMAPVVAGKPPEEMVGFADWIGSQPRDVQLEVLGPRRFQLLSSGVVSPEDLIDPSGNRLTLAQLSGRLPS